MMGFGIGTVFVGPPKHHAITLAGIKTGKKKKQKTALLKRAEEMQMEEEDQPPASGAILSVIFLGRSRRSNRLELVFDRINGQNGHYQYTVCVFFWSFPKQSRSNLVNHGWIL
jgi:hypothetical protein